MNNTPLNLEFPEPPVVDLRISREIADFCRLALYTRQMAYIWGPNQTGKTIGARRFKEMYPDNVFLLELAPGGAAKLMVEDLMVEIGDSARSCYGDMVQKAFKFFRERRRLKIPTLVMVDELHEAFIGRSLKIVTIELIRRIHDIGGCGVVSIGTMVIPNMFKDPRLAPLLAQSSNRGVLRRTVGLKPYKADVISLCEAYGFDEPNPETKSGERVWKIANENGIGKLGKYFQVTQFLGTSSGRKMSWTLFEAAVKALDDYEAGKEIEEIKKSNVVKMEDAA